MATEDLIYNSGWNNSGFAKGLREMEKLAEKSAHHVKEHFAEMGAGIGGIFAGALAVEGIKGGLENLLKFGSQIRNTSQELGISTDNVQGLQGALEHFGVSSEQATTGLAMFANKMELARHDAAEMKKLADAGISWKSVAGGDEIAALKEWGDHMKEGADDVRNLAEARELLGRGGAASVGFWKQGSEAIAEHMDAVKKASKEEIETTHEAEVVFAESMRSMQVTGMKFFNWLAEAPKNAWAKNQFEKQANAMVDDALLGGAGARNERVQKELDESSRGGKSNEAQGPPMPKGASPVDPRVIQSWEKFNDMMIGDGIELAKAQKQTDEAKAKFNLEAMDSQEQMNQLAEDFQKLQNEYVTATGPRALEIERQKLQIIEKQKKAALEYGRQVNAQAEEEKKAAAKATKDEFGGWNNGWDNVTETPAEVESWKPKSGAEAEKERKFGAFKNFNAYAEMRSSLESGGLDSGGLSAGGLGGNASAHQSYHSVSNAHGLVRAGDAARRKAEAAAKKSPELTAAQAAAHNTALIAKGFGLAGEQDGQ